MTNTPITNESEAMEVLDEAQLAYVLARRTGLTRREADQAAARVIATALEAKERDTLQAIEIIGKRDAALAERDARIAELEGALNLAANRLDRLTVEFETGTLRFIETAEWTDEARAILTKGKTHD